MTDSQMWSLIVGALLPPLIAVIQRPTFPAWARALITVGVCCLSGFVTVLVTGQLGGVSVVSGVLLTLVAAISTYESVWRKTGVTERVERRTSPDPAGAAPPAPAPAQAAPNPMPGAHQIRPG